jgi:hypothetical protein
LRLWTTCYNNQALSTIPYHKINNCSVLINFLCEIPDEDASSPPPWPSDHRDESDPATWPAPRGHDPNGPISAVHDGEREGHGRDSAVDEDVTRMGTPSGSLWEGTGSGNSKPSGSSIEGGRDLPQRKGKRVSFPDEEGTSYEEGGSFGRECSSVTRGGAKYGEQGVDQKTAAPEDARTLYGASGEESDDDDFSFGGLARPGSGKVGRCPYAFILSSSFLYRFCPSLLSSFFESGFCCPCSSPSFMWSNSNSFEVPSLSMRRGRGTIVEVLASCPELWYVSADFDALNLNPVVPRCQ